MKEWFKDKKHRIIAITGLIVTVLLVVSLVVSFVLIRNNNNNKVSDSNNTEMQNETDQNNTSVSATSTQADQYLAVKVSLKESNSWEGNGQYFSQYDAVINNGENSKISGWKIILNAPSDCTISQKWNCEISQNGSELNITPVDYNKEIVSGQEMSGVGFIVSFNSKKTLDTFCIEVSLDNGTNVTLNKDGKVVNGNLVAENNSTNASTEESQQNSQESQEAGNGDNGNFSGNSDSNGGSQENTGSNNQGQTPNGNGQTGSAVSGRLHVSGTNLVNESGTPVQLRGVSTHGLAWYPQYVNYEAFKTLRDDWGANVVRLAMYTYEYGGYCNGGDKEALKTLISNGVEYATQLGMYVIIDWHVLNEQNPNTFKSEAISFFTEMSAKYANYDNVIYEICNEPINSPWSSTIKPYAKDVISAIRANDSRAVIIVGTNNWSQNVDEVIGDRLDDDNVMYALHFYAATHKDGIRNKLTTALNAGLPIFVSECSITDASGNGGIDYDSANTWINMLNSNNISFICWSLSNKAESSALISSGCNKLSGWTDDELSDTGRWFKNAIKN